MNDESAFHRWLDLHPDDHDTRKVFADFLEERDDPRAEGYRALGRHRVRTDAPGADDNYAKSEWTFTYNRDKNCVGYRTGELVGHRTGDRGFYTQGPSVLPQSWMRAWVGPRPSVIQVHDPSRRVVEDGAALGWALLPEYKKELFLSTEFCES